MPAHILSPQSFVLPNISVAFAVLGTAAGATALLYPADGLKYFGLRPVSDGAGQELSHALARVYGIRNASTGISTIAIYILLRNSTGAASVALRKAIGLMYILSAGVPFVDGLVCQWQGKTSPWNHWLFAPVTMTIGAALLATSDAC